MQRHFNTSDDLCKYVAGISPDVLLSFSLGKDSICAWLQMRGYFRAIHPYYLYLIPDLEFVEDALRRFEDFFQSPIARLPHPSLYRMLKNLVFQTPERCHIIEQNPLPALTYDGCSREIIQMLGLPANTFTGHGVRAADSLMRLASIKKWGSLNDRRKTFMPIYDWNADRLEKCLMDNRVKLPADYEMFGRSFDGIDIRFLLPIKERFPRDYKKILDWFPLAELEIMRSQWRAIHA